MGTVRVTGRMVFDPRHVSRKHEKQASWKATAVLQLPGEDHLFYSWLVRRRYGLELNRPARGSHVTFVNDRSSSMRLGAWDWARNDLNGTEASVTLSTDLRTNGKHWWLPVIESTELSAVRRWLGLAPVPFWPMHMTVGHANERNIEHSEHLHGMLRKGLTW